MASFPATRAGERLVVGDGRDPLWSADNTHLYFYASERGARINSLDDPGVAFYVVDVLSTAPLRVSAR
ncbi:MAG: hypothetical protein U0Q11_01545 [Vicinamibacterales bacterium]